MHGIQAWVALPTELEETSPSFEHRDGADLPTFDVTGGRGRLVAGSAYGLAAGVRTHSPMFYVHWELQPGSVIELPAAFSERAAYVAAGEAEIDGRPVSAGQMLVFDPGNTVVVTASAAATVMLLGGEPVGPRFIDWNFVSSSKERIKQAKADWRAGRMKLPDLDHDEFVPLP